MTDEAATAAGGTAPALAVVVIALGAPPETIEAIRSLLTQDTSAEIVVINSGGGGMAGLLAGHGIDVPVIECEAPLFVGAARNLGIRATRAPIVAFLAADCRAMPKWVRVRVAHHVAGHAAVGSAVLNDRPRNPVAWAAHLLTYGDRLPGLKRGQAYGASYDRGLFGEFGLFREDLRTGEDTEFRRRLPRGRRPVWQPNVRTLHRSPATFTELFRDQFDRGGRKARANADLNRVDNGFGFRRWSAITAKAIACSRDGVHGQERWYARLSWPLIPLAAAAYCAGGMHARRTAQLPRRNPSAAAARRIDPA